MNAPVTGQYASLMGPGGGFAAHVTTMAARISANGIQKCMRVKLTRAAHPVFQLREGMNLTVPRTA